MLLVFGMSSFVHADIFVNEFLANGIIEPDSEWVELFNNGSSAVDLAGYNISETSSLNITLNASIPPKGFIILTENLTLFNSTFPKVNASGIRIIDYGETVPNFELANTAGAIELYNSSGDKIDSVVYAQNSSQENVSIGRYPDGSSNIINLSVQTPGDKNDNNAPTLNRWLNPKANNSFISGLFNITVNITDDAHTVNISLVNFNSSNFTMNRSTDLFYFLWNTSLNSEKAYNITIFFNDSLGLSATDTLFNITIDNTLPNITSPATTANARNFINPGFVFNASVNATDTNLLNVTCTLGSTTVGNFSVSGRKHICNLTAPSTENDFEILFIAIDKAGNKNTTNISFTTKYTTFAKLIVKNITVTDVNQSDKIVEVNATLDNTGSNPIYDAAVILDSFSSTKLSPVSYKSCSLNINSTQICNVTFNITIAGGTTGTHNIFWSANWSDNNFTKREFDSVTKSSITIANNPQLTAANNISTTIEHGKNATLKLNINSTGNFKLENVNVRFIQGTIKSVWLNTTSATFSSIEAGSNESLDINMAVPKHTNPNNYTGIINITATGISDKIVRLIVEVPLDSSWNTFPNETVRYAKSSIAGLAGNFTINNTGNIGHNYSLTKSGNFVTYNLWNSSNPTELYVEAGNVKTVSIYHLPMEDNTPPTIQSFNLTLTITSSNTSQTNKTFISLIRDDNNPNINITTPLNNSFVKGSTEFKVNASDLNLSRIEFYINNTIVIDDINLTRKFNWNTTNSSYPDEVYELKAIAYDSAGNFNTSTTNVTVNNTDDAPILIKNIPTITIIEDNDSTILNLSLFFKTIDGDSLKYDFTKPSNVTVHVNNDTQIANFTPSANFSGINFIIFTAVDTSNQTTSSNNITINVTNVNDAPTIPTLISPVNDSNMSSATGKAILTWNSSIDADNEQITYYVFLSNESSDIKLNTTTNVTNLEVTGLSSNKTYFWNVLASDNITNSSSSKTFQFLIIADNNPVIHSWRWNNTVNVSSTNTSPVVAENKTLSFVVNASDPDNNAINFTWFRDNVEINNSQNFTFNLTNNFTSAGTYTLKFTVTDNNSNLVSQEWQVSVTNTNREPILDTINNKEVVEDFTLAFSITAFEPDNDSLTFTSNISSIIFTKDANNSLANVSWTPTNDNVGNNTVQFTVIDSSKNDSKIIVITVNNTNDAPEITDFFPKQNKTIAESAGLQQFNVTSKDVDVGDDLATYWFRNTTSINTTLIASNSSNVTVTGLNKGTYNITAIVNDTSGATARYEWKLTVTTEIVGDNLTSNVLDLNETQRQNVTNAVINSTFGGIDFRNETLNFSGVVKLEDAFNISKEIVSINTKEFPKLNKSAFVVMKGFNFTKAPLIFVSDEFESTSDAVLCPDTICTNKTYDRANGILSFMVTGFSTYFTQTNTTNAAPFITSTPLTTVTERTTYQYDVKAVDPDGDTLIFSLITKPSGMSITSTGIITWVPTNSQLGSHGVSVNVSDSNLTATQNFTITVTKGARLTISNVEAKIDGRRDKNLNDNSKIGEEAKPGSKVEFKIELENLFTDEEDLDIEDIEVEIIIEDIDDGDDLEDDVNGIDIKEGKDETVNIEFGIPLEVEEETFDVLINVEGEDENNTKHEIFYKLQLEVEKEEHEIKIIEPLLSPPTIQCDRKISINTEIINTGANDEDDVSLEVSSLGIGISSLTTAIKLDEGTDDNRYSKIITETISENILPGVYPIIIKTMYDGKESETKTLELTVKECEMVKEVKKEVKEEKPKVEVIRPITRIQPKLKAEIKKVSFAETDKYSVLLAISIVIFIGTLIFVVGGAFIVLRK